MTPTDKAKPREFWIDHDCWYSEFEIAASKNTEWPIDESQLIHLVEMSAFTALQAENAKLKEAYVVVRGALETIEKRGAGYNLSLSAVNFRLDCDSKDAREALAKAEEILK